MKYLCSKHRNFGFELIFLGDTHTRTQSTLCFSCSIVNCEKAIWCRGSACETQLFFLWEHFETCYHSFTHETCLGLIWRHYRVVSKGPWIISTVLLWGVGWDDMREKDPFFHLMLLPKGPQHWTPQPLFPLAACLIFHFITQCWVFNNMIRRPSVSQLSESLPGLYPYLLNLKVWRWFGSVQSLSGVQLFATPWAAACQASLSIANFRSLLKLMSIESVMPSNHLILHCPLLLLPSIFPSIRVFSNESVICIRWPEYWSWGPVLIPV